MNGLLTPEMAALRRRRGLELKTEATGPRLFVLGTFNLDLLPPFLLEALDRAGLAATVSAGGFGQLAQTILDPASALYDPAPDEILIVPACEDLLAPLFELPGSQLDERAAEALVDERLAELSSQLDILLERLPAATCYVVAMGSDHAPVEHVLDPAAPGRRQQAVERWLQGVRRLGGRSPRIVVVDWDWHSRRYGSAAVRDDRLWYLARMRLNQLGLAALADVFALNVAAYGGRARKVVALDFDGTLWGGIVGEAGVGGLDLGEEGVGLAFQDVQRELLKLRDIGVLLVACSKNNLDDAVEVFEQHPAMILRREHLAAERINWQDKATNLRELAAELRLGLDSFVFLDDNPVEREWVREACPEVLVPDLPEDPVDRVAFLRSAPWFARIATTDADLGRAASYEEQRGRTQLHEAATSFEGFLASLEQQASIDPVTDASLGRAAQMCQRTNQFNLTTKRYTAANLEALLASPDNELYTLSVADRFGDSGITGLAILRIDGQEAIIDTFLLSCRVLGRRIEDAFLAFLADRAVACGATSLLGLFEQTAKNSQVARFYADRGFDEVEQGAFRRSLTAAPLAAPPEIMIRVGANA
jgi:FkbH-like protein